MSDTVDSLVRLIQSDPYLRKCCIYGRYLHQTKCWWDRNGVSHDLDDRDDMDARYAANICGFLDRRARQIADMLEWYDAFTLLGAGGASGHDDGHDWELDPEVALDRLHRTPLYKRLLAIAGGDG